MHTVCNYYALCSTQSEESTNKQHDKLIKSRNSECALTCLFYGCSCAGCAAAAAALMRVA
jgi:hypothetical protein